LQCYDYITNAAIYTSFLILKQEQTHYLIPHALLILGVSVGYNETHDGLSVLVSVISI